VFEVQLLYVPVVVGDETKLEHMTFSEEIPENWEVGC
jgi:hypothetical protein